MPSLARYTHYPITFHILDIFMFQQLQHLSSGECRCKHVSYHLENPQIVGLAVQVLEDILCMIPFIYSDDIVAIFLQGSNDESD